MFYKYRIFIGGVVGIGTIISLLTNGILVEKFRGVINHLNILQDKFSERMVKNNG